MKTKLTVVVHAEFEFARDTVIQRSASFFDSFTDWESISKKVNEVIIYAIRLLIYPFVCTCNS